MNTTKHEDAINNVIRSVGKDKLVHVIVGVAIFASARWVTGNNTAAFGAVAAAAIIREIYDSQAKTHGADMNDIIATLGGGVLGYLCQFEPIG